MATSAVYVAKPNTWMGQVSAANTNRDGSGTVVTIMSGNASSTPPLSGIGSRIDTIRVIGVGTVSNGVVRLFLHDGTNYRLFKEVMVIATTPSVTVEEFTQDLTFADGLVIQSGWSLRASTHLAETFNIIARGGDY